VLGIRLLWWPLGFALKRLLLPLEAQLEQMGLDAEAELELRAKELGYNLPGVK
jgi:hypothetical protein